MQKSFVSPVALLYRVAVLLANMRTCIRGSNEISEHLEVQPPSKFLPGSYGILSALTEYMTPR